MKKSWKTIAVIAVGIALVLAVSGVVLATGQSWRGSVDEPTAAASATVTTSHTVALPATDGIPSDAEAAALLFMREEEKLARDVYQALYDAWGAKVFKNIAVSESRHMESVKALLDAYGLADPVGANAAGVFVNSELQTAYVDLVAKGTQSLIDAYEVGKTIEELDIEDLEALLTISQHADITEVAQNLLNASENHLAAFNRQLAK